MANAILTESYDPLKHHQYSQWTQIMIGGMLVGRCRLVLLCGKITMQIETFVELSEPTATQ